MLNGGDYFYVRVWAEGRSRERRGRERESGRSRDVQ
jgi:hypothetical protein